MRVLGIISAGALALAIVSCGSDDPAATTDTGGASTAFTAGQFQLTTHAVTDQCLSGGLELLFMPDGKTSPYAFKKKDGSAILTEVPGEAAVIAAAAAGVKETIDLPEPFKPMEVTIITDGAGKMKIVGAKQVGVTVDAKNMGDCTADMVIDADITLDSASAISMNATVSVSKWASAADNKCPSPLPADPCTVKLDIKGARQ